MPDSQGHSNWALGVLLAFLLGPVALVGYALAAIALLGVATGWTPAILEYETPIDFLYGGGSATLVRWIAFIVGSAVGTLATGTIAWGFTGKFKAPWLS